MQPRKRRARVRVHVLALHQCTPLVPVGLVELLRKTAQLAGDQAVTFDVTLVSAGKSNDVVGAGGMTIRCAARLQNVRESDLVIVPAIDPDLVTHLRENAAVVPWLQQMFARGADVASACTGSFLLGDAGLLDGRAATTHWAFQELFARRFPRTNLLPQAILVDQGRVVTAGGATSFINLALHLGERIFGSEVVRAASKMFLVDVNKAPQSAYAIFSSQKLHEDSAILKAQSVIERHPSRAPTVEQLAKAVGMSPRTFARRFRHATGNTPLEYVQRVRIEEAKRELESGERVASVASAVGYNDAAAFRQLFTRVTGLSPADYRARYGPRSTPSTITLSKRGRIRPSRREEN